MATLKKILVGLGLVFLASPAYAQEDALALENASLILLAASVLFGVCVLMVAGFALWQSHRCYVDQVNLSHKVIENVSDMTRKLLESVAAVAFSAGPGMDRVSQTGAAESAPGQSSGPSAADHQGGYSQQPSQPALEQRIRELEAMLDDREAKFRDLEARMSRLQPASSDPDAAELDRILDVLDDTELAVLQKLAQDPDFFEHNSFATFGTTSKILDSLTEKQLVARDASGRSIVPAQVIAAMKYWAPGRR